MRFLLLFLFLLVLACAPAAQEPALPAPAALLRLESALPEYERNIDHAGFIRGWNAAAERRGERIYQMVCHACHGDANLRGSLPEALAFAHGKFQRGSDPYAMYQTLTRGWRQMAPQVQLVPEEKYDVIHFIREAFLAASNREQLFIVTEAYLAGLPKGNSRGPRPMKREPWKEMNYGEFLIGTFELADEPNRTAAANRISATADFVPTEANIAYKAIGIRLDRGPGGVAAGSAWVAFEHDTLRVAGGWTGEGFIDWNGINFNSRHVVRPRTIGELHFELADGPGWANPQTEKFADPRIVGADGRRFGPLPREWARYRGLYRHGERVVISYTVGDAAVLESHDVERFGEHLIFVRTLNIGRSSRDLLLRVANAGTEVAVTGVTDAALTTDGSFITLRVPAASTPRNVALRLAKRGTAGLLAHASAAAPPRDLREFTRGGPAKWAETFSTAVVRSDPNGAFEWARFTLPLANTWRSRLRLSGLDFLPGGKSAVLCDWDGDVWRVDGIDGDATEVTWRRIAAGLFQPLGIKVRDGTIFVTCRDQLVALRDLNGDGETDFYESINSDHQVTEHFHEFAMGLQTDAAGNFYYAKSARHARTPLVPHHGTLLKVSADGARTEIVANGFRAANGVCVNPDGSFFVTDQEGHWMPSNRINRVVPGRFYGNMWSHGAPADPSDAAMAPPLCWIDKAFDRSPGELLWVEGAAWGALRGALLNLSYGRGRMEIVVHETNGDTMQGAVCALPMPDFPTGIMRGRFHPQNGQLYVCGLSAWGSSMTQQEGGLYRVRPTGKPAGLPVGWQVVSEGMEITFSEPPQRSAATDVARYGVTVWGLQRSANYGSPRINERALSIARAEILADPRVIRLSIPGLQPTQSVEITCRMIDANGREVERVITGTIHHVPAP